MAAPKAHYPAVHLVTRAEWRQWLAANHASAGGVWLVCAKKESGGARVEYNDAVEEAICFGWTDGRPMPLDEERYQQFFSPRRVGSAWSKANKERAVRLIGAGLMAPAGLARIEAAKADGSWQSLDAVEALALPAELAAGFDADPAALRFFDSIARSIRKDILWWLTSSKRPQTRAKRIADTLRCCTERRIVPHSRPARGSG